jgi:Colicin V production protein
MEVLQRLQPLDVLFAILWAGVIGWGLQTGFVRQLGMLIGMYGAAVAAGALYHQTGKALAAAFGEDSLPQLEFFGYAGVMAIAFGVIGVIIWRAYPRTRLSRTFGADNVAGAVVASIWGVVLLIELLTILRFYAVVPAWHDQEATQRNVREQIQLSQMAPVLEVVAAPLWNLMVPWFPVLVDPHL